MVVLGASRPGVMLRPCGGSARPWVELASLPPAVTWELAAETDSGDSVFPQWAVARVAHSSQTLPLPGANRPELCHSHLSSTLFPKLLPGVLSRHLLVQMPTCGRRAQAQGPLCGVKGEGTGGASPVRVGRALPPASAAGLRPSRAQGCQIYRMKMQEAQ